jgi:hypothetical protein
MFDIADKNRTIGIVMVDGSIGQMMEPAEKPTHERGAQRMACLVDFRHGRKTRPQCADIHLFRPESTGINELRMIENSGK